MQLEEFKSKLIDETLNRWSNTTAYRWSDVFDYICDYWDLDKEWENYFNLAEKSVVKRGNRESCHDRATISHQNSGPNHLTMTLFPFL